VEEIVAAVGRKPQLRKHHEHGVLARRLLDQVERSFEVVLRIPDAHDRRRDREARKAMPIEVEEVFHALF
jgi:hypothetical protein